MRQTRVTPSTVRVANFLPVLREIVATCAVKFFLTSAGTSKDSPTSIVLHGYFGDCTLDAGSGILLDVLIVVNIVTPFIIAYIRIIAR